MTKKPRNKLTILIEREEIDELNEQDDVRVFYTGLDYIDIPVDQVLSYEEAPMEEPAPGSVVRIYGGTKSGSLLMAGDERGKTRFTFVRGAHPNSLWCWVGADQDTLTWDEVLESVLDGDTLRVIFDGETESDRADG